MGERRLTRGKLSSFLLKENCVASGAERQRHFGFPHEFRWDIGGFGFFWEPKDGSGEEGYANVRYQGSAVA